MARDLRGAPKREVALPSARPEHWLGGGGAMGKVVLAKDWSATPLGPIESWPQSLRTTISLCLASNFPISIAWGPEHTQIYNDGYWPICGAKHPDSMGQNFAECWASAWPAVGPAFERALEGETSFLEDQRMFLDRNGYLEETFFTFSFSPIRDESGGVGGLFHPVTETTGKMLNERRIRALRDLAARTSKAPTVADVLQLAVESLAGDDLDLPFLLVYRPNEKLDGARLVARHGVAAGATAAPETVRLDDLGGPWPLGKVARSMVAEHVEDLRALFGSTPCGPYPELPRGAVILPITPPGATHAAAVVVAGISARLPFNETYRSFYDLVAATITASIASAQAYEDARQRAEALAEIDRAKTAFFSNVSHEFRTPLTLMLGPTEAALASPERTLGGDTLEAVYRNELRLLKLVNTLLDFSRIEAGRTQASYVESDLAALTIDLASAFRSAIERAGLQLHVDCPPLSQPAFVDHGMWEKIVLNLLSNAFKFTFEGAIGVSLREQRGRAILRVVDSGTGIAAAELPRLFERFHRVEGVRARTHEGSGIGLALVDELVRLHGGDVQVASELGRGTTFTVAIPLGRAHLPAGQIDAARTLTSTATGAAPFVQEALRWVPGAAEPQQAGGNDGDVAPQSPARVLIADDNADMRDYIARLLGRRWQVEAVADGDAALRAARRTPPDIIVSDIMMPGLDGFGLLQALRRDPATLKIPVILLSARAGEEAKVEGLEAGADDYLVKPFSAKELIARIQTHLTLARLRSDFESAQAAVRMRDEFLSVAGHELRTPLTALQLQVDGLLRVVGREQPGTRVHQRLDRASAHVHRLGGLVDQLLDISRLTASGLSLSCEPCDLAELAREVVERFSDQLADAHSVLTLTATRACSGHWDAARLDQVLTNLVGNAVKYGRGAPIEVALAGDDDAVTLTVTDHGIGVRPEDRTRIFERFERAVPSKHYGGFGLGLWISRQIVEAHGGGVTVDSEPGVRTRFVVTLPRGASDSDVPPVED